MVNQERPILMLSRVLLKYSLAALFIFIPLYPKFPLFFVPNTSVAIRAEDFLLLFSALILTLNIILEKIKPYKIPLFFQIATFCLIGGLSLISSIIITQTVSTSIVALHWIRRIEYLFGFFLVYISVKNSPKNLKFFLDVTLLASVGVLIYGIAQIYFKAPIISTMNSEFSKGVALTLQPGIPINSSFAGHYDLSVYLVFILSIIATKLKSQKIITKLSLLLLFIGQLWLLFQTGSRMSALAGLFAISLIFFLQKNFKCLLLFWFIFVVGVANSPSLTGRFQSLFKILEVKRLSLAAVYASDTPTPTPESLRPIQQDRSTSIRFDVEWPRALRAFFKNPVLGTGYSSISLATDNDYLRALGETGILGLLSFLAILIAIAKKTLSLKSQFDYAYLGIFLTMTLTAIFLDVFEASKIAILFWMFTGLKFASKDEKK
jgi:O-antigen ligase